MQHVLLKAIDPELYRCLKRGSIEPQLYALRWMRCLFSNVLSKVNVDEDEDDEGKYSKRRSEHREWSTVVDISILPPSFKPVLLSFLHSPVSKTLKQVFFNPIKHILTSFTQ